MVPCMPAPNTVLKGVLKPAKLASNNGGKPPLIDANGSKAKEALKSILKRIAAKKKIQINGVRFGNTKVYVHEAEKGHRLRSTPKSVRKKGI